MTREQLGKLNLIDGESDFDQHIIAYIDRLTVERDRLQDAVKEAYFEGFRDGERRSTFSIIKGWEDSDTKARLKEAGND